MAKTERSGHTTTNHDFIRQWVEERGGWPARVKGTADDGEPGLIRIDFPGYSGEGRLERIEWEEWFQGFEENGLAFLHRDLDHGGGDLDRFNKLVKRTGDEDGEGSGGGSRGRRGRSSVASSARSRGGESGRKSSSRGASSERSGGSRSGGTARETSSSRSGGGAEADTSELRELLLHELGDLLSAERLFVQATRALAREAQDPEVRARVEQHVTETEGQVERVREAFAAIGERAKAVKCEAAVGLKEEHDSFKSEEKPSKEILSAFGLGSGLRVEHYEIAAYRSAIALATALGERECAEILKQNLDEEVAMASFLEKTSRTVLKRMAGGPGSSGGRASAASKSGGTTSRSGSKSSAKSAAKKSGGSSRRTARSGSR